VGQSFGYTVYGLRGERLETHTFVKTVISIYDEDGKAVDEYVQPTSLTKDRSGCIGRFRLSGPTEKTHFEAIRAT
jgi:hypothetical protein